MHIQMEYPKIFIPLMNNQLSRKVLIKYFKLGIIKVISSYILEI